MRSISDILEAVRSPAGYRPLPRPKYTGPVEDSRPRFGLAVEGMARHMTDEGWQIFKALEYAGYNLAGYGLDRVNTIRNFYSGVDVRGVLSSYLGTPGTVVLQDKREYEGLTADRSRDPRIRFRNVTALRERDDLFKVTILKDAQNNPAYHKGALEEIGANAVIVYYAPRIVTRLAPYLRADDLVRTYHSLNFDDVPPYSPAGRSGTVLSGAISGAYPLRGYLATRVNRLPETTLLSHPGYHRNGRATPAYLLTLSRYKVSIATSSVYGYALRKIIESTAAGCTVVTDLPFDEVLPEIDANLVRVSPTIPIDRLAELLRRLTAEYDPDRAEDFAKKAVQYYDYRPTGERLAADIEDLRRRRANADSL